MDERKPEEEDPGPDDTRPDSQETATTGDEGGRVIDMRNTQAPQVGDHNTQINIFNVVPAHPDPGTDPDEVFATHYRNYVARVFDQFEFFGVDPSGIPRKRGFERGYVAPTLVRDDPASGSPASAGERADRALAPLRLAILRGVAGSGKSTLLRWLGWQAAKAAPAGPGEKPPIPFLIELGRYTDGNLPNLEQVITDLLRPRMPEGWVRRMLEAGRVLLLLDGLDEVRARHRDKVESWLQDHLYINDGIRCVVSTRPSVVAEQRWLDEGFVRFDLLPMSRYNVERFVRGWHGIAREDYPADTPADRDSRAWLTACENNLLKTLTNRPALGGMSANPLLCGLLCVCGLLCALHREGEHLPESRKDVYDAGLELLVVRWPIMRRRRRNTGYLDGHDDHQPDSVIDVRLNSQEQLKLLQRLAFWMVTNEKGVLDRHTAPRRVRSSMAGLREARRTQPDHRPQTRRGRTRRPSTTTATGRAVRRE